METIIFYIISFIILVFSVLTVTTNKILRAAVYLLSELASGTTGEIIYVDSGYHIVGMKNPNAPDISKV